MYTRYSAWPASYAKSYIKKIAPNVDDTTAKALYRERIRYLEILTVCLDISTYLLVLSLRATSKIDEHAHLQVGDNLIGYSRASMQEMLVIRVREFFNAEKGKLEKFQLHGFHQSLHEMGIISYPLPNTETNDAIARIIHRRIFYSAHHGNGKNEHSFTRNRLHTLDLITAMTYIAKVEENLHGSKLYDPFERLLNDELGDDGPLTIYDVYETMTCQVYEKLNYSKVLEVLSNGDQVVDGEYEETPEFLAYRAKARKELVGIRAKVAKVVNEYS